MKYLTTVIVLLSLAITTQSCIAVIGHLMGVNNHRHFKTTDKYLAYAWHKNRLPAATMIYPDSATLDMLYRHVNNNNSPEYFGSFLNDSTEVQQSAFLMADNACGGRIVANIDTAITTNIFQRKYNDFFKQHNFHYLAGDKPFIFRNDGKVKVFLLYSCKMGRAYRWAYTHAEKFVQQHKDKAELYTISMDYTDDKK